jgi:hypothetical protein
MDELEQILRDEILAIEREKIEEDCPYQQCIDFAKAPDCVCKKRQRSTDQLDIFVASVEKRNRWINSLWV